MNPGPEALAIEGERLVFVGDDEDVERYIAPETEVIDLKLAHTFDIPVSGISETRVLRKVFEGRTV